MTTATSEQARPEPVIDPALAATAQTPASTDTDDIEFQEALAAAKAEETAGQEPGSGTGTVTGDKPVASVEAKPAGAPAATPLIPKPRLDEALNKLSESERKNAYLQGQLDARKEVPAAPAGKPAATEPTPEDRIAAVHLEIDALAEKFDAGDISMKDYKKAERALLAREATIREEVAPKPTGTAPAPAGDGELYLETLTAQLEEAHPWSVVFEQVGTPAEWELLKAQAAANLKERGVDLSKRTTLTRYELRKEVATLADEYGPALLTARATAKGVAIPGQTPAAAAPAAPGSKPLSPEAQARQAALKKAAGAPPSLANMAGTVDTGGGPSDQQIESMSDDDYDKLPTAVRNKLRGIT